MPIVGGGGKIGECIAMELVKEDAIIVLWDVNQSKSLCYWRDISYGTIWCGVVWCDVVWCGVVWCGVVCYVMLWYDMIYGIIWYGMV